MMVCRIRNVKIPAITAAPIRYRMLIINSLLKTSSVIFPFNLSETTLIDAPTNLGVNNANILAIMVITIPIIKLYLYFKKYLLRCFRALMLYLVGQKYYDNLILQLIFC